MRAEREAEPGDRDAVRAGGAVAQRREPVEELDVRDGAIRIAGGGSDGDGVGVAEGGVVSRVGDGHAGRHIPTPHRYGHDGGSGGESGVVGGDRGERVAADGEAGRNGVGRVVGLAKECGPVEERYVRDGAI